MKLKLLGVSGSLRAGSSGLNALGVALETAREHGAETRTLDLRLADLPMYNPEASLDENTRRVLSDVAWAEAFILATPDYHGSMSGAMKNFLDYHWSEFSGKLFGYICSSHEKGITAMEQMRIAIRQCYGWSLPYGVAIHGKEDFMETGAIRSHVLQGRLKMLGRDIVVYGSLLYSQFVQDIARKTPDSFSARYG